MRTHAGAYMRVGGGGGSAFMRASTCTCVFVCGCLRMRMRVCWCFSVSVLNQGSKRVGTTYVFLCTYIPVK